MRIERVKEIHRLMWLRISHNCCEKKDALESLRDVHLITDSEYEMLRNYYYCPACVYSNKHLYSNYYINLNEVIGHCDNCPIDFGYLGWGYTCNNGSSSRYSRWRQYRCYYCKWTASEIAYEIAMETKWRI